MTSSSKLNILVLHALGDPELARSFLVNHVFCLKKYHPTHNYLYHDVNLPLPDYAKDFEYDGVILDVTCLFYRWDDPNLFARIKAEYSFLTDLKSFKIALPQDEYDCNELLDEWMSELNVDVVYSVLKNHHDILYPQYHKKGQIKFGFTGYIDRNNVFAPSYIKPFKDRQIDVGYRTKKLPYYFGRLGQNKWEIADLFISKATLKDLKCDISVKEKDTILGFEWFAFINNCKFTLGANSGSSLLDPRGQIQRNIKKYMLKYPLASFNDVEKLFFPDEDGRYVFTAISPRIFEATLLKSGLILVKGDYSGIIKPWEHYIPLEPDCSNFNEVYDGMRDSAFTGSMIENCLETLLSTKELHYEHFTDEIISLIHQGAYAKGVNTSHNFRNILERYNREMPIKYKQLWQYKHQINRYSVFLKKYPRLHNFSKNIYNLIKPYLQVS